MGLLAIVIIVVLGALGAFIWRQSKAKSRWRFGSVDGTNCPRCGTHLAAMRKPASTEQMLWGGWTCPNCGCKVDKYGREIAPS
jgi:hypothetical protein